LPAFLAAVAGGTVGDTLYYTLGRAYGARLIRALPFLRRPRARAVLLLRRWGRATAFLTRFAYGLRIVLPLSIGSARLPWPVFLLFNLLGSVAFAATYLCLGYLFGETLEEVLGRLRGREGSILLGIALAGAAFWAVREWRIFRSPEPGEPEIGE
ncbi:MAG TPA: DedA family protein, partial [Longimicrobiaceae bacterium]